MNDRPMQPERTLAEGGRPADRLTGRELLRATDRRLAEDRAANIAKGPKLNSWWHWNLHGPGL